MLLRISADYVLYCEHYQNGKLTPRFTLVALLEGMPISDRPKIVWSIPTNRLKPVGCKLNWRVVSSASSKLLGGHRQQYQGCDTTASRMTKNWNCSYEMMMLP